MCVHYAFVTVRVRRPIGLRPPSDRIIIECTHSAPSRIKTLRSLLRRQDTATMGGWHSAGYGRLREGKVKTQLVRAESPKAHSPGQRPGYHGEYN